MNEIDIQENDILQYDSELLPLLIIDRTRSINGEIHNLLWATDNYSQNGPGYGEWDEITVDAISGEHGFILRPRVNKTKEEQDYRTHDKAEVFTSAWICNRQNNSVDEIWFGSKSPFNIENGESWISSKDPIPFPSATGLTWKDYVKDTRLEMTCGEAPYLASRYNVITGEYIPTNERIGLLDRKLRVVCENTSSEKDWFKWAQEAFKSIYGYEWQGDNLILARESLVYSFIDFYEYQFGKLPPIEQTRTIAEIVSWNLWQMDGLKAVIPGSCYNLQEPSYDIFGEQLAPHCRGCEAPDEKGGIRNHIGIYCKIMDWHNKKPIRYVELLK